MPHTFYFKPFIAVKYKKLARRQESTNRSDEEAEMTITSGAYRIASIC